jgi:hypothetical protein
MKTAPEYTDAVFLYKKWVRKAIQIMSSRKQGYSSILREAPNYPHTVGVQLGSTLFFRREEILSDHASDTASAIVLNSVYRHMHHFGMTGQLLQLGLG